MQTSQLFSPQMPDTLSVELINTFNRIVNNYREGKWEPSELNGGKFCEVVYCILKGYANNSYPTKASKPRDMVSACRQLEQENSSLPRSVRIQIPRVLIGLYEIRNNRGVGHVGGDVNPNHMDSIFVLNSAKWIMAELVRIFHNLSVDEATSAVEALIEREVPDIWKINGKKRVLSGNLSMKEKALLLLYSEPKAVHEKSLIEWIEHSNGAVFRRDVIMKGHKSRFWEYDKKTKKLSISPVGIEYIENNLLKKH